MIVCAVSGFTGLLCMTLHLVQGAFGGSYGQSKLAQIMYMRALQHQLRSNLDQTAVANTHERVKCLSITPGAVWTNIFTPPLVLWPLMWCVMRSAACGAQVIKMACMADDVPGGAYLSNCYVKPSEGKDDCSNVEAQWTKLWELSEKQSKEVLEEGNCFN